MSFVSLFIESFIYHPIFSWNRIDGFELKILRSSCWFIFIRSKNLDQLRERWTSIGKVAWIDRQRKVNKRFRAATRVDRPFAFFFAFFPLPPRILVVLIKKRREREREGEKNRNRKVYLARYTLHLLVFVGHRRDTLQRGREKKGFRWAKQVDAIVELDSFHLCSFREHVG